MRKSVVYSFFFLYLDLFFGLFFFFIHHTHIYIHLFYVNCCCGRAKWHSFTIIISFFRLCFSFFAWLLGRPRGYGPCLPFRLTHFHQPFLLYFFLREKKRRKRGGTTATAIISLPLKRRSQNIKWKCNFLVDHGWFFVWWWISREKCSQREKRKKFASWSLSRVIGPHFIPPPPTSVTHKNRRCA